MYDNSIAILICYFGEFPWYFQYFIHSCRYNPSIDFFIITDNINHPTDTPNNVKFLYRKLVDIRLLASQKLGFSVSLDFAYKLCDFKPAYGYLFSDLIEKYTFWGQSDIDVIYGDIRGFMTETLLNSYDFISLRHDYTTGCFALYRNDLFVNTLFKNSKDYQKVFTSNEHYCFDECNFQHDALAKGKSMLEINTEIESFTYVIKSLEAANQIRAHFDFLLIEGLPGRLKFDNGKILYSNKIEGILYHLIYLKKIYRPKRNRRCIGAVYRISATRIYNG